MKRLLFLALLVTACGAEESTPQEKTPNACDDVPLVTYENFGAGFLAANCQSCHASGAADRHDAPANITFDNRQQALSLRDRILVRAGTANGGMPPGGGLSDEQRQLVTDWLTCGDPPEH